MTHPAAARRRFDSAANAGRAARSARSLVDTASTAASTPRDAAA
jgi:hypothetical protein